MTEYIRTDGKIKGIQIAGENYTLAMYADNIIICLCEPEQSIKVLIDIIEEYGNLSGYTLNTNKSQVMLMGCTVCEVTKNKYAFHWEN